MVWLLLFELRVGLEHQLPDPRLGVHFRNGPEEREAPAFAVQGVLAGGERDVSSAAGPALPYAEANELQAVQGAVVKVEFRVGELARAPVCLFAGSRSRLHGNQPLILKNSSV